MCGTCKSTVCIVGGFSVWFKYLYTPNVYLIQINKRSFKQEHKIFLSEYDHSTPVRKYIKTFLCHIIQMQKKILLFSLLKQKDIKLGTTGSQNRLHFSSLHERGKMFVNIVKKVAFLVCRLFLLFTVFIISDGRFECLGIINPNSINSLSSDIIRSSLQEGNGKLQATTLAELWSYVRSLTSSCSICGENNNVCQIVKIMHVHLYVCMYI